MTANISLRIPVAIIFAMACPLIVGLPASAAGDAPIAPLASPEVYKILAENDQWRVIEATWQPGQEDNYHSHPGDRVSLIKTDCKLQITKPDGKVSIVQPKAGRVSVRTGKPVSAHKAKNIGDKICIIRIVELK